jgi:flavorubredoxin
MSAIKISDSVNWVGVKDPGLVYFDITMKTEHGTTYNSYIVKGSDKTVLIDTVKKEFTDQFIANVEEVTSWDKIDYLLVNHTEPDHSGAIGDVLDRNPNIEILCSAAAVPYVKNVLNREAKITGVKDNHEIDLGDKKLTCRLMPYMHWPDTMMEYLDSDKVLFSNDGFAAHYSFDSIWTDEVPKTIDIDYEVFYYFSMIMRPFTGFIRRNMAKLDDHEIAIVAPSHGPLHRKEPRKYLDSYKDWSKDKAEGRKLVTIFYASNYGNTASIADQLALTLNENGFETAKVNVGLKLDESFRDMIEQSTAVVVGTPTFNGDAVKPIWDFVNLFSTVYSIGKKAAVFGSYGWGGEGAKMVADRLSGLKMKVFEEQYRARLVPSDDEKTELRAFGQRLAEYLG